MAKKGRHPKHRPEPAHQNPEGPGWYSGFMRSTAEMSVDDELADSARIHIEQQQKGRLYVCAFDICSTVESTVDDMRTKAEDQELLQRSGGYEIDFGEDPWFVIFSKPLKVPGMDGRKTPPLVSMVWSPPDEFAFIDMAGDTAFVQWPRRMPAMDLVGRSESYASLAHFFLTAVVFRSAWQSGSFEYAQITDPEWIEGYKKLPDGGCWIAHMSDRDPVFQIDGQTQR